MNVLEYYKYALLATSAYVRMGTKPLEGAIFADEASSVDQSDGRLPSSIANYLFAPTDIFPNISPWTISHYHAGDTGLTPDDTGLGATLFRNSDENVLAIRGVELPVDLLSLDEADPLQDLFGASIGGIGMLGVALTQLVELTNLIERLYKSEDGSSTVKQVRARFNAEIPQGGNLEYLTLNGGVGPLPGPPVYLVFETYEADRLGILDNNEKLTLTGHSLGGHLAAAAAQVLPQRVDDDVVVFNSPGFDPIGWSIGVFSKRSLALAATVEGAALIAKSAMAESLGLDTLLLAADSQLRSADIFAVLRDQFGTAAADQPPIVRHLESEDSLRGDDLSLVASFLTGTVPPGAQVSIPTEVNSHSIEQTMDALALHAVFERLNSNLPVEQQLTLGQIKPFVDYARNEAGKSEEFLVESLHALLIENSRFAEDGFQLQISDASDGLDGWTGKGKLAAREAYHVALLELNVWVNDNSDTQISFESLIEDNGAPISANRIIEKARNDPNAHAYRYALKNGLPFAVIGADYDRHNNGALELYKPDENTGELTNAWLEDIAEFYHWKNRAFIADLPGVGDFGTTPRSYVQLSSDIQIYTSEPGLATSSLVDQIAPPAPANPSRIIFGGDSPDDLVGGLNADRLYGGGDDDKIQGGGDNDHIEGNAGDDQLSGGTGNDDIWGGAGADTLLGGKGDDRLDGGLGFDTYEYQEGGRPASQEANLTWLWNNVDGDGNDTITDPDGLGEIHFTTKEGVTHVLNGGREIAPNSDIWKSVDSNGDFDGQFTFQFIADVNDGILLVNGGAITIESFTPGDLGIDLQNASAPPPPPPDRRVGTASFDGLFYNFQNTAEVTFEGIGGPDVLQGGRFDDALYGDAEANFANLDTLASSSLQGDFVSGEAGDDLVVGSNAVDVLSGGPGSDDLYSGPGDDLIYGDFGAVGQFSSTVGPQWQIVRQSNPFQTYVLGAFGGANEASWLGGADIIYSGSGNDTVFAGGQDDVVFGGTGNDVIGGDDGDDTLFGEANDDLLMGDRPDQYYEFVTNELYVESGNDLLYGGGGNDELWGVRGNDYLYGGAGNDIIRGDSATPWFASPPMDEHGDDYLEGNDGSDNLYGDGGNDYLDGGAGDDTMFGDNDDDTDPMYHGEDWLNGGDGWDLMAGGGANDTLFGGSGNDLLMGDFARPVSGFHGDDYLDGEAGNDYLVGGGGADTLFGGSEDDLLEGDADFVGVAFHGNDLLDGEEGNDSLFGYGGDDELFGGTDNDYLDGGAGNDTLFGGAGVDQLFGGAGDDYLDGGAGTNHLHGGGGADTFFIATQGANIIVDADALDTVEFAPGVDIQSLLISALIVGSAPQEVKIQIGASAGNHVLMANTAAASVAYKFDGTNAQTLEDLLQASGQGELVISGDTSDNTLYALGRSSVLAGGVGNDLLVGSLGDDSYAINAGDGQDTLINEDGGLDTLVLGAGVSVQDVHLNYVLTGLDTSDFVIDIGASASLTVKDALGKVIEHYRFADGSVYTHDEMVQMQGGLQQLILGGGAGADVLTGGAGDDRLFGQGGDDMLAGGQGNDRLVGGAGDDAYLFSPGDGHDTVKDTGGHDHIQFGAGVVPENVVVSVRSTFKPGGGASRSYGRKFTLGYGNLGDAISLEGNLDDIELVRFEDGRTLTMNQLAAKGVAFSGSTGEDNLDGIGYTAVFDGGPGQDLIYGGTGDDTYRLGRGDGYDFVIDLGGANTVEFGAGITPADVSFDFQDYGDYAPTFSILVDQSFGNGIGVWRGEQGSIGSFRFEDGQVLSFADLVAQQGIDLSPLPVVDQGIYHTGEFLVVGGAGDDHIDDGDLGEVTYLAGQGDDYLDVYAGDNYHYFFNLGDGQDRIWADEYSGETLYFGAGITPESVTFEEHFGGLDVLIGYGDQGDAVYNDYGNYDQKIERFKFADGQEFSYDELRNFVANPPVAGQLSGILPLTDGNDVFTVGAGSSVAFAPVYGKIQGRGGNDTIYATDSNAHTLEGGPGNDTLNGGAGHDTYLFNQGDGVDTINDMARPGAGNSIVFGAGISYTSSFSLGLGSLLLRVGDQGDEIHLTNFDQSDVYGQRTVENFTFADGTTLSYDQLLARGFDLFGTAGDDTITGTNITDRIDGLAGNDTLLGGSGSDTYIFSPGSGQDVIREVAASGDIDTLQVLANPADVIVTRENNDIVVNLTATTDRVAIDWFTDPAARVEQVSFTDGTLWDGAALEAQIQEINQPPIVANALADQITNEDALFNYQIPADAFSDVDAGDNLSYTATLSDGTALPGWLSFDASTRSFSGKPLNDDVGIVDVQVTATDLSGASASEVFALDVANTNDAPLVANALTDQSTSEDALFNYQVPTNAFADIDAGDALSYSATLLDGSVLPGWLSFDASTRSFDGRPQNADVGNINVQVTATDLSGASASDTFALDVVNTNDAPVLANALQNISTNEDAVFSYQVPADAFADVDAGDTLSYSAALPDGSALPGWLKFDPAARSFSGIPKNDDVGTLRVRVSATDSGNLSVSDDFDIAVANTNDAPTLVNAIADQAATEDTAFSFIVPANAFADVDVGDALSYTATLADGTALPDWLRFDAATRRFGGTPENADVGSVDVRVVATDVAGVNASDDFVLSVANVNDAPLAHADAISAQEDGAPLSVPLATLLANDSDIDVGDVLSVTAASNSVAGAMVIIDTAAAAVVYDTGGLFQSLAQGQSTIDTFSYTVSDTFGATSTAAVQVTVSGVNDAPVANADDVNIAEGDSSGNLVAALLANDTDVDYGDVRTISAVDTLGTLGTVIFDSFAQSLDYSAAGANFDALGAGATASDSFAYTVSDITGATSTATVNVTVDGVNDAPVLVSEIAGQAALEDNPFTFQIPHGSFTDVDTGDVLTYRARLGNGSALPEWLSFDAAHLTFSGMPFYENAGTIMISVTATDLAGVSTTGLFDLSVNLYPDLVLTGGAHNDTLVGHSGNDYLDGGAGADTMIGAHGDDTYIVDSNGDTVIELLDQGIDTVITPLSYTLGENVENLTLTGNGKKVHATGNASNNVLVGNDKKNTLTGLAGIDWLDGGADDDKMAGGTGDDTYVVDNKKDKVIENAGEGTDTVRSVIKWDLSDDVENLILVGRDKIDGKGNDLDNLLVGNSVKNKLDGKDGNDIIQGLAGDDDLKSKSGSVLMDGGAGDDKLDGSRDNELYIGSVGDDEIKPDKGADVIAFNRGDGRDQVKHAHDGGNTLSLGGGIAYDDLKLSRQNNDLIFDTGAGEGINFADWYMGDHKSVINLQVVAEAMAQFDANSSDPLINKKVQTFDFAKVVGAFEAAGQVDNWALTNALLDAHLTGSDSEALGGDLAYQYGVNGSLSGIGVSATQDVLNAPQFGTGAQTLRPIDQLNQDKNKLA
jgi:VCBS repeat-containing protein